MCNGKIENLQPFLLRFSSHLSTLFISSFSPKLDVRLVRIVELKMVNGQRLLPIETLNNFKLWVSRIFITIRVVAKCHEMVVHRWTTGGVDRIKSAVVFLLSLGIIFQFQS